MLTIIEICAQQLLVGQMLHICTYRSFHLPLLQLEKKTKKERKPVTALLLDEVPENHCGDHQMSVRTLAFSKLCAHTVKQEFSLWRRIERMPS